MNAEQRHFILALLLACLVVLAVFFAPYVHGAVIIEWDANTETDLAGYKIYRDGELVGVTTATTFTDPQNGTIYFIRAFNNYSLISVNSRALIADQLVIY